MYFYILGSDFLVPTSWPTTACETTLLRGSWWKMDQCTINSQTNYTSTRYLRNVGTSWDLGKWHEVPAKCSTPCHKWSTRRLHRGPATDMRLGGRPYSLPQSVLCIVRPEIILQPSWELGSIPQDFQAAISPKPKSLTPGVLGMHKD